MVPDYYTRKQTLANAERYITPELKELEDMILGAEDKLYALEYELYCRVRDTDSIPGGANPAHCESGGAPGCVRVPCTGGRTQQICPAEYQRKRSH